MIHPHRAYAHLVFLAALTAVAIVLLAPATAHAQPPPTWRWPLPGDPEVVRGFDPPDLPWGAGHRGVDLGASAGEPVYAAGAGRVGYVGRIAGRGIVTVVHDARRTTYLPVTASVRVGERVSAGSRIGSVEPGFLHCPAQVCLHWGLIRGTTYLDPLSLLPRSPIRLLPLNGPPLGLPLFGLASLGPVSFGSTWFRGEPAPAASPPAGPAAAIVADVVPPAGLPRIGFPAAPYRTTPPPRRTSPPEPAPRARHVSELAQSALAGTGGASVVLLALAATGRASRRRPDSRRLATAMYHHPAGRRRPGRSGQIAIRGSATAPTTRHASDETDGAPGHLVAAGRHRRPDPPRRLLNLFRRGRAPRPPTTVLYAEVIDLDTERRIRRPSKPDEPDPA